MAVTSPPAVLSKPASRKIVRSSEERVLDYRRHWPFTPAASVPTGAAIPSSMLPSPNDPLLGQICTFWVRFEWNDHDPPHEFAGVKPMDASGREPRVIVGSIRAYDERVRMQDVRPAEHRELVGLQRRLRELDDEIDQARSDAQQARREAAPRKDLGLGMAFG